MNQEMQRIWQEVFADLSITAAMTQFGVIVFALVIAWMINGAMRAYVMRHAPCA